LVDGECVNCKDLGQGSFDNQCVDCGTVLEGSAPNPDTAQCKCPPNQMPSVDGTKCENSTGLPLPDVCEIGQGLVDNECKDCKDLGQGSFDNQCVQCNDVLEGSAPDEITAECKCPEGQVPSEDGTKCEDFDPDFGFCPTGQFLNETSGECQRPNLLRPPKPPLPDVCEIGQGLVNGICVNCNETGEGSLDNKCVECGTVLEGSAPNPDTAECECPPNQIPSVDGTKCEVEPDTGTDPPSCLGGAPWYAVEERQDDEWCNKNCCAPGCEVESGCCSYENGVSTGGSYDGVHEVCWDENPDPQKFPDWYHGCALCPGFDAGSQEKECLEGQGWIDDPKNCVDCNDVLKNSFPNAETGECECRINQIPNDDGTECIWDPNAPFDSSSKNGSDGNTDCTDPTDCSEEDPTEMPSATLDMPSLLGSDSGSDAAAEETPSTTDRPSLPGSDSALDAAAEETPSTTGTPPLPGSDTPTVDAKETPSTTATPPLPGSDTPTVDAN